MDDGMDFKTRLENGRGALALTREIVLIAGFLVLIFAPQRIRPWLIALGVSEVKTPIGDIQLAAQETKTALTKLSPPDDAAAPPKPEYSPGRSPASEPSVAPETGQAPQDAEQKRMEATRVLQALLVKQEDRLRASDPTLVPAKGWIYLGRTDSGMKRWLTGARTPGMAGAATVAEPPDAIKPGAILTIIDGVNMRQDSESQTRASAPVVSVVKEGEKVTVIAVDTSRKDDTGAIPVWANIVREAQR
jgi:hypothetical protein